MRTGHAEGSDEYGKRGESTESQSVLLWFDERAVRAPRAGGSPRSRLFCVRFGASLGRRPRKRVRLRVVTCVSKGRSVTSEVPLFLPTH